MQDIQNIILKGSDGKDHKIADHKGEYVVLYFYPKDSTPGCTIQGRHYSCLLDEFKKLNTVVYGVSRDGVASKQKFIKNQGYKHILLADWPEQKLAKALGVLKEKSMMGKKYMGIDRSSFIFDKQGKLIKSNLSANFKEDAEDVLNFIKSLK